jgi:hypothetical protein
MEQDENDQYYKKSPRRSWVTNQMGNPDKVSTNRLGRIVVTFHDKTTVDEL